MTTIVSRSLTFAVDQKVRDALSEHSYAAEIAGVSYSLGASDNGVSISLGGYNDKILELLDVVPTTVFLDAV